VYFVQTVRPHYPIWYNPQVRKTGWCMIRVAVISVQIDYHFIIVINGRMGIPGR
jgi:hypothetical protein